MEKHCSFLLRPQGPITDTPHDPDCNESAKVFLLLWAALWPGRAVGVGWCPGCSEQRQAVRAGGLPGIPWGRALLCHCSPLPTLVHTLVHPAKRSWAGGFGQTSCAWAQKQGEGKGRWAVRLLLQLGEHQFLLEEEKAALTPSAAPQDPTTWQQHQPPAHEPPPLLECPLPPV